MTEEGRLSRRARKQVDYSQFGGDEDFEDDFKESNPPPSKKCKVSNDQKTKKERKERKPRKDNRKTIDDKVYQQDLELALALSKSDSSQCNVEDSAVDRENNEPEMPVLEPEVTASPKKPPTTKKTETPADVDEIEVLEENIVEEETRGRRKRRAAAKAVRKFVDSDEEDDETNSAQDHSEDEEFQIKAATREDDDDSEDQEDAKEEDADSSDFEGHWSKTKKKGRGRGRAKAVRAVTPTVGSKVKPRISATVQPVNKGRGRGLTKTSVIRPESHNSASPPTNKTSTEGHLVIRKPSWIPPGSAGEARSPLGGINVRSPGTLRLGLSKKSKVKPLHGP